MAWIFEPQRNIADEGDTETMHVPCSLADATIVAKSIIGSDAKVVGSRAFTNSSIAPPPCARAR